MLNPFVFLLLLLFTTATTGHAFAAEVSDGSKPLNAWNGIQKFVPTGQLERWGPLEIFVAEPKGAGPEYRELPVLVFLKGFLPSVGLAGYMHLLHDLVANGITVIAPVYLPDSHQPLRLETQGALEIQDQGYMSFDIAFSVFHALEQGRLSIRDRSFVLYGHSLGARVAMALAPLLGNRVSAIVLDGVPDDRVLKDGEEIPLKDTYRMNEHHGQIFFGAPVTFITYAEDRLLGPSVWSVYQNASTNYRQLIEIFSYKDPLGRVHVADHFASMTTDPSTKSFVRGLFQRFIVAPEVEKLHGYPLQLVDDEVDDYALKTLLPAAVFAHSPRDWPWRAEAHDFLYHQSEFVVGRQLLRKTLDRMDTYGCPDGSLSANPHASNEEGKE